jgi:hypothetical protein
MLSKIVDMIVIKIDQTLSLRIILPLSLAEKIEKQKLFMIEKNTNLEGMWLLFWICLSTYGLPR